MRSRDGRRERPPQGGRRADRARDRDHRSRRAPGRGDGDRAVRDDRAERHDRPALPRGRVGRHRQHDRDRRRHRDLSVRIDRARAAGLKFKGDRHACHRPAQRLPRVRDHSPGARQGERWPHEHRRQQSVHGLRARGVTSAATRSSATARSLGGHVTVEDYAAISAYSGVHQFCRVGKCAFVGGYSRHARRCRTQDGRQPGADLRRTRSGWRGGGSAPSSSRSCGGPTAICSNTTQPGAPSSSSATRRCAPRGLVSRELHHVGQSAASSCQPSRRPARRAGGRG